jgi:large subunit ribosomal protein L25
MAVVELRGDVRRRTGKGGARQVRRDGFIPAILYGGPDDPKPIKIESHVFETLIRTPGGSHSVIDFKLPNHAAIMALIREVQRDPVSREVLHVDFQMIEEGKPVHVALPLHLVGIPKGVKLGGILEHITREIDVRCLPRYIVSSFDVNVEHLGIGDTISLADIEIPDMEVLTERDRTIAACVAPSVLVEPVAVVEGAVEGEAAPAEPKKEGDGDKSA